MIHHSLVRVAVLVLAVFCAPSARGQGIDCAKARDPISRGICASPELMAQDTAMARAYAQAIADPAQAEAVRAAQIQWIRDRNAACGKLTDAKALQACLTRSTTQRLAQLLPPASAPRTAPSVAASPAPPPSAPIERTAEALIAPEAPAVALVAPQATLDQTSFPAAEQMETLLHVTAAGAFVVTAKSTTGTALQLVDMLTGPSDTKGEAGQTDGRIDALLDIGTYKIRAFAAAKATGTVQLSVTPVRDAADAAGVPVQGRLDTELADLQQRRFWLSVKPGDTLRIEAAGRALGDLRLWRNGRDLVALRPQIRVVEPTAGHPLTDMVLAGKVEPGSYEVIAYGIRPLAWPDGAAGAPFHLRSGVSDALAEGWVGGRIGPFGTELYRTGALAGALRLDIPQPVVVSLELAGGQAAAIARNSREPVARLDLPGGEQIVTVRGAEGQPFRLRALDRIEANAVTGPASLWVGASAQGFGGDEPPATALMLRARLRERATLADAVGIRIGPGLGWRHRFNLRGTATFLLNAVAAGAVTARADGVAAEIDIVPLGAVAQPRADGVPRTSWDLAAGWYVLSVTPLKGAVGIVDLAVGPADALPAAASAPGPADPVLGFAPVTLDPGERLSLSTGTAAQGWIGMVARALPVDLAAGAVSVTQEPGATIDLPVRLPGDGAPVVSEIGAGAVPVHFDPIDGPAAGRIGMLHVAAAGRARTVAIAWRRPPLAPPPVAMPPPPDEEEALAASAVRSLDLARDTPRSFALTVPEGGLYRVETLGRLHTAGAIGSAFLPELDSADANGVGQNMLIQRFLRAGRYRVTVAAHDSDGHLGVLARPATLATGATLVSGGLVRARMAADGGVVFPIEIVARGSYHLDLLSLGKTLTARLEDAEGWPLLAAGDLSSLDQDLLPGHYRLLVQPTGVAARVVARLTPVIAPPARDGHGPFALAFDSTQRFTWREPPGRGDVRTPDAWTFALAGPSDIRLAIGDGMVADVKDADGKAVARIIHGAPFAGTLPAGPYRVETASLGRNDRLDYTLALSSTQLQPDRPRKVKLPSRVAFAVAQDRVVSLTSFGPIPLRAVLRRDGSTVVARFGERGDDWNIAVARRLPAGSYTLDLASAAPPKGTRVTLTEPTRGAPSDSTGGADQGDDAPGGDASVDNDGGAMADQGDKPQDSDTPDRSDDDTADSGGDAADATTVSVRLALPPERAPVAVPPTGDVTLPDGGVHVAALPAVAIGQFLVVAAASSADLALTLERQEAGGLWRTAAVGQGTTPLVAVPGDGAAWRVSVWTVDGGAEKVRLAARVVDAPPQAIGRVTPTLVLPGIAVARVAVPGAGPLMRTDSAATVGIASSAGRPMAAPDGGLIVPQSEDLWLVAHDASPLTLTQVTSRMGAALAFAIPESGSAVLPATVPPDGKMLVWLAESGLGQPGVDAGRGMGVAAGSALSLGAGAPARIFNAGTDDSLRLRVTALALASQTPRALDAPFAAPLPPRSVTPVTLPQGRHLVRLDLAAGTAVIADWRVAGAITAWAGDVATSRAIEGDFTEMLLVNTADQPTPVALGWTRVADAAPPLAAGVAFKRFFGAAGSLDLPVQGPGRLVVVGGTATLVGADGHVARGTSLPLAGPGRAVIEHGAGLLAAWVETPDRSPWPQPAPQTVSLPLSSAMHDMAMALAFTAPVPMLLHARTTAPVILALGDGPPALFPGGAEFHRAIPAGAAILRVISPHDGPLSGTLDLDAEPIAPATEGVGADMALAPGASAAFGFDVARAGPVGVGVRAEPDRLAVRLLRADGTVLGEGVAQLHRLPPGRYILEASVPPDGTTTTLRPAIVGIGRRPNGPPPDVVNTYLALAGRAPVPFSARP